MFRLLLRSYEPKEKPDGRFYDAMRELSAIGNNINQLARKANAGFASRDEVTRALRMLDRVYELMYGFSK